MDWPDSFTHIIQRASEMIEMIGFNRYTMSRPARVSDSGGTKELVQCNYQPNYQSDQPPSPRQSWERDASRIIYRHQTDFETTCGCSEHSAAVQFRNLNNAPIGNDGFLDRFCQIVLRRYVAIFERNTFLVQYCAANATDRLPVLP